MSALIFFLFLNPAYAENEKILSDSIAEYCEFSSTLTEQEKMDCGLFMVNCVIGSGGKWNDKGLFECMKKWRENETS